MHASRTKASLPSSLRTTGRTNQRCMLCDTDDILSHMHRLTTSEFLARLKANA
jgi:hypothetical protein